MIERASAILIAFLFLFPMIPMMGSDAGDEVDPIIVENSDIVENSPTRYSTRNEDEFDWERSIYPLFSGDIGTYYDPSSDSLFAVNIGGLMSQGTQYPALEFDMYEKRWDVADEDYPPTTTLQVVSIVDERNGIIYKHGGNKGGGDFYNDLHAYDTSTGQWSTPVSDGLLPVPVQTCGAVCSSALGMIFIHHGITDSNHGNTEVGGFHAISTTSYTVMALNDGTEDGMDPRGGHSICIDEKNLTIYSWGGMKGGTVYSELWQYNLFDNTWIELEIPSIYAPSSFDKTFFDPVDRSLNIVSTSSPFSNLTIIRFYPDNGTWNHWESELPASTNFDCYFDERTKDLYYFHFNSNRLWSIDLTSMRCSLLQDNNRPIPDQDFSLMFERDGMINYHGKGAPYYLGIFNPEFNVWEDREIIENGSIISDLHHRGICYASDRDEIIIIGSPWQNKVNAAIFTVDLEKKNTLYLSDATAIGNISGTSIVYNPNDCMVYGYGGYRFISANNFEYYSYFFKMDPETGSITMIDTGTENPGKRWGVSLLMKENENEILLYGGSGKTTAHNDLWTYDVDANRWSKFNTEFSISPSVMYANMFIDEEMNELYVFGGSYHSAPNQGFYNMAPSDEMYRLDLLKNRWEKVITNTRAIEHLKPGFIFDEDTRDLRIFGLRSRSMWQTKIPLRTKVIGLELVNPTGEGEDAYSMYDTYNLEATIFSPGMEWDMDMISLRVPSTKGYVYINYTLSDETWEEYDPLELVDVKDIKRNWNGRIMYLDLDLEFDWDFRSPVEGNTVFIELYKDQELIVSWLKTGSFRVKNSLTLNWDGSLERKGDTIGSGDWVRGGDNVTIKNMTISYENTNLTPPAGLIGLDLMCLDYCLCNLTNPSTYPCEMEFPIYSTLDGSLDFYMEFEGIDESIITSNVEFNLKIDQVLPDPPTEIICYPDEINGTEQCFDNDLTMFFKWMNAYDGGSGIAGYYWSLEDNGGTDQGNFTEDFFAEIEFPSSGTFKVYIWPVDKVGNIGYSEKKEVFIDDEPIEFRMVSPDLTKPLPYDSVKITMELEDFGGSDIDTHSVQYRYTNNGNKAITWKGVDAWKDIEDVWSSERKTIVKFDLAINELSLEPNNIIQFRATDGAGTEYRSDAFYPVVDERILSPTVTLDDPVDGSIFEFDDQLILNWSIDSHYPERIRYDVYLSKDSTLVDDLDAGALYEANLLYPYLEPVGLDYGTYYWDVVPVFDKVNFGTSFNGPISFKIEPQSGGMMTLDSNIVNGGIRIARGGDEGNINFELYNPGPIDLDIEITLTIPEGITLIPGNKNPGSVTTIAVGETLSLTYIISAPESLSPGIYEIILNVTSMQGSSVENSYTIEIMENGDKGTDEDDGFVWIIGVIILVLIGIILIVFLVIRSRSKVVPEDHLQKDEIDSIMENGEPIGSNFPAEEKDGSSDEELIHEVASRYEEAHEHDRDKKKIGYEEMYGKRMIHDVQEETTTEELKDYIEKQVEELENMEIPEENDDLENLLSSMPKKEEGDIVRHGSMGAGSIDIISIDDPYDHQGEFGGDIMKNEEGADQ